MNVIMRCVRVTSLKLKLLAAKKAIHEKNYIYRTELRERKKNCFSAAVISVNKQN